MPRTPGPDCAVWTLSRRSAALRLARRGISLLPLGALVASAWLAAPPRPPGVQAAPVRRWAGMDLVGRAGRAMAPFRMDTVLPGTIELSALNGTNGFTNNGVSAGNHSGDSVSDGGDVNGDGFDDILIGAPSADGDGPESGQSYVIYGGTGLASTIELSAMNGTSGFIIKGDSVGDRSGESVSAAGDVNGDGFDDILIGAPNINYLVYSGRGYVAYGGSAIPSTVELSALNGANGFRINGISTGDRSGDTVSGAGDVNGDGFADILIGAYGAGQHGHYSGRSYVVYGGSVVPGTVELSALNGTTGFRLNGISTYDFSGHSVSGAGDVNGDGLDDILIGSPDADPHAVNSGQCYLVYGGTAMPSTVELSAMNGTNGFFVNGISSFDLSGYSVSGAGDMNGDGFDDIVIRAPYADPHGSLSGQTYVVYGGSALQGTVDLSALNGATGFRINGIATGDGSGLTNQLVNGTGDVNGDGFDDIVIGASYADPNGNSSGQGYVVYGGSAVSSTIELSALNGTTGFRVNGISTNDWSGWSVSGAGDLNGDGFDDTLIGAPGADPNGAGSGQNYVIYGGGDIPPTPTPTFTPTSTTTTTPARTSTATNTSSATPTATSPSTSTRTPTPTPTATPTSTPTPTPSPTTTSTSTPTPTHPRGDCNADNTVNAADVSSLVLEIFDGDGNTPAAVPGGTYPGDPIGCNANADAMVDAGDLACVARLIFGSGGGCGP